MMSLNDFFTSGWTFTKRDKELKSKFQMMNIGIILSSVAVIYGTILNVYKGFFPLASFEFSLVVSNIVLWYLLRKSKKLYDFVSFGVTAQFTLLLILLAYISSPQDMKLTWLFTYPIIILYFKNEKYTIPWFLFLISMLLIVPLQPYIEVQYTFFQLFYLSFVLVIVSIIVYFYKVKMDEASKVIASQEQLLLKKVDELTQKDKMLTIQSKQAVMGEMISMIAHQWRQPLSTVTLTISNLQVKKLLGENIKLEEYDNVIENISDTVVYLAQTIDDFQTYFKPNKKISRITVNELIDKAISFARPRFAKTDIELVFKNDKEMIVNAYANELIQVLLNIINNAVDELIHQKIDNPKIIITLTKEEEAVLISISDNAGGIKDDNINSIFEAYFSTKGKNGTGLGLYMSQMIMEKQFHTSIEVKNINDGATFMIRVPENLA